MKELIMNMEGQTKKMNSHKLILWIGLGSIIMMFAGLTSAYIIKRSQLNWQDFSLPTIFMWSTAVIVFSSLTMYLAQKAYNGQSIGAYRRQLGITLVLGVLFMVFQIMGFKQLASMGLPISGNVAGSFVYVLAGAHLAHILGGVIALLVIFLKSLVTKTFKSENISLELVGTYWHFVDILWVYLLVFLILMR